MHVHLEAYLDWLAGRGVQFTVAQDLRREPDHEGVLVAGSDPVCAFTPPGVPSVTEYRDTAAGVAADHATYSVARALIRESLVSPGDRFWDVGCGTGVLAVVGSHLSRRAALGVDVDPAALAMAKRTAEASGVVLQLVRGSLLEPLSNGAQADVIAANLPHKPIPAKAGFSVAQAGGEEGDALHRPFLEQVRRHVSSGARIVFALHSLPHPRLLKRYEEHFDLTLISWKRRFLGVGEYGTVQERFLSRSRAGTSLVLTDGPRRFFLFVVWVAVRR